MSFRTCCCKKFALILALLALVIVAAPAFAQSTDKGTCLQDEYNQYTNVSPRGGACTSTPSSNSLVCTAGDVSISTVDPKSVFILSGGQNTGGIASCFQGGSFNFVADFDILTQANATNAGGRDNIGLYFANVTTNPVVPNGKGTSQALCGTCVDNIISAPHTASGASCTPTFPSSSCFGSDNYHENDPAPDNCGDTSSTDLSPHYGAGQEGVTIEVDNYSCSGNTSACATDPTKQCLVMQYCTSWQTPGSSNSCFSDPTLGWPYVNAATPGTKSKCNCSTVQLPITPISVTASIAKSCTTSITKTASTSCDEGPEGLDFATYTVTITPTVSAGNGVVDQICDTAYGTVVDDNLLNASNQRVFPSCAAGSTGLGITGTSCAAGATITGGTPYSCTFTAAAIGETKTVTDQVSASGHASLSPTSTFTTGNSNSVSVFSEDAPSTAKVTKGFVANEAACVTVRYSVDVSNTSGADEVLSLTGLTDNPYGDITQLQGSVLGTNCGVATTSAGLGTFVGKCTNAVCSSGNVGAACASDAACTIAGAGAFPATLGVTTGATDYTCNFDAQFCTGSFDGSGCFTHSDTASAALSLDNSETNNNTGACTDANGNPVACLTETKNTLNVKECLVGTVTP